MCNRRPTSRHLIGELLLLPFAPSPDWYRLYWLEPKPAARWRRLFGFIGAVIRSAMSLPAEIRRAAKPCNTHGEWQ